MEDEAVDNVSPAGEGGAPDLEAIRRGLVQVRGRRRFLWSVLLVYLPLMWTTQKITHSFKGSLPVFFAWCVLLVAAMAFSAVVKCPRCGNYFHVHGITLLYLRRCLHCQLHVTADKTGDLS